MVNPKKKLILNLFQMAAPSHNWVGLWRHPRDHQHQYNQVDYWVELAKTAEKGLFDCIFIADVFGVYDVFASSPAAALASGAQIPQVDPSLMVSAMAHATEHVGFGITSNIHIEHPYSFARKISSLDHITKGRLAWNIVTGYLDSGAKGLGYPSLSDHDARYDLAEEYMTVLYKLLEGSWQNNAVLYDKARGVYIDPTKVRSVSHRGQFYQMEGIALTAPSPQRTPVLFQAGSSTKGKAFAAQHAEATFINAPTIKIAKKRVSEIRQEMRSAGRLGTEIKILLSATVIVAETTAAAMQLKQEYEAFIHADGQLALVSGWIGKDLSRHEYDDDLTFFKSNAIQTTVENLTSKNDQAVKIRDLTQINAFGSRSPVFVGDAQKVADEMEQWVNETDIDGFNLVRTVMPESITSIVAHLIPELQQRGLFKTAYAEGTLREKLTQQQQPYLAETHIGSSYRFHTE